MVIQFLLAIAIGIILGIISGLIPGIHVNLIASLSMLFYEKLVNTFTPVLIILVLVSMLTTSIFLNFIPTLILGVPDPDKVLMIRPLHKAVLKGKAYTIIKQLSLILFLTSLACILLLPILYIITNYTKELAKLVPLALILIIVFNLKDEKNKYLGIAITLLAGILGIAAFSIEQLKEPLLPLLSGLFGMSSMLLSLAEETKFVKQHFPKNTKVPKKEIKQLPYYTSLVSLFSFIPAVSSSQIVALIRTKKTNYLFACASFTIATALISFLTVYTLNKARNGVAVAAIQFVPQLNTINLILIIITVMISAALATILLITISKPILKNIQNIPYKKLTISIIILILILTIIIAGPYGIIVLILSTSLGIITSTLNLNRNYLMSALIIPTFFYFI